MDERHVTKPATLEEWPDNQKRKEGRKVVVGGERLRQLHRGMRKAMSASAGPLTPEDVLKQFAAGVVRSNEDRASGEEERREAERLAMRAKYEAKLQRRAARARLGQG